MIESAPARLRFSWMLLGLIGVSVLPMLQSTLASAVVAAMRESFGTHPAADLLVRLSQFAPAVGVVAGSLLLGGFADRLNRSVVLSSGAVLFAAVGVLTYLAGSLELVVGARLLLGAAIALITMASTAAIGDNFSGPLREQVLGLQAGAVAAVASIGPLLGSVVSLADWQLTFLLYPVALIFVPPLARLHSPVAARDASRSGGLPRSLLAIYLTIFCGSLLIALMTGQIAFHAEACCQVSQPRLFAGICLAVSGLFASLLSFVFPHVRARLRAPTITVLAFGFMGAGYLIIAVLHDAAMLVGVALCGAGFGLLLPNLSSQLLAESPEGSRARAASLLTFALFLGQLVSPLILSALVAASSSHRTFAIGGCFSLLVAGILSFRAVRSERCPSAPAR